MNDKIFLSEAFLPIFFRTPVLKFLALSNRSPLEKTVLDCGAGGEVPPLALFAAMGYTCTGIDIDTDRLDKARTFFKANNISATLEQGDIRALRFEDDAFSFSYSFNTIFHLKKKEIQKGIEELHRVTAPGGGVFFNVLSVDDWDFGEGDEVDPGEFMQVEGEGMTIHSYFEHDECEKWLTGFDLISKEEKTNLVVTDEGRYLMGDISYFLKVKKP
ncbi:MAG TPA: class I SAM-dependent methyltransferase [Methanomicrobia archaeon]|nr:class I SAM-dependent methyltransferase [Methanomicrobia archaeon]